MITLTDPIQESICLDSFLGITRILDNVCDHISDEKGRLEDFNDNFIDQIYQMYGMVDILYPIMNTRKLEYRAISNFYLKKINLDTEFAGKKVHSHMQERLNFAIVGNYDTNKMTIFPTNEAMTTHEVSAIGIKPESCELIFDQPLAPKLSRFNEVIEETRHGICFICVDIESYSESQLFEGFKHPVDNKSKFFSLKSEPKHYSSHYTNIYIAQWKLDRNGRNIYEIDAWKPKVKTNVKDREELSRVFNDILSNKKGKISIEITGTGDYYEDSI